MLYIDFIYRKIIDLIIKICVGKMREIIDRERSNKHSFMIIIKNINTSL